MILYDTQYLQLKSTKSKTENDWIYAHRPNVNGVVVILPIIGNEKVLFLIEERPPIQAEGIAKYTIGIPAGLVGDERSNESVIDAIQAELLEETGLKADSFEIVSKKIASSPGCVTEIVTIAKAYIKEYNIIQEPVSDGGVITDRILVDIKNIRSWLKACEAENFVITAHVLAALFYLN